jgi:hypothetical protein
VVVTPRIEMLKDWVWLCAGGGTLESVTFTLKEEIPPAEGVPVRAPEEVFRFNPAGREPEATLYVKGDVPPVGVGSEAL